MTYSSKLIIKKRGIFYSDGRNIAPSVTRILYSKFVAGASDCHLLGYSLLAKIFVNSGMSYSLTFYSPKSGRNQNICYSGTHYSQK